MNFNSHSNNDNYDHDANRQKEIAEEMEREKAICAEIERKANEIVVIVLLSISSISPSILWTFVKSSRHF